MDSPQPPDLVDNPLKAYLLCGSPSRRFDSKSAFALAASVVVMSLLFAGLFLGRNPAYAVPSVTELFYHVALAQAALALYITPQVALWVARRVASGDFDLLRLSPLTPKQVINAYYSVMAQRMRPWLAIAAGIWGVVAAAPLLWWLVERQSIQQFDSLMFAGMESATTALLALGLWRLNPLALALGVLAGLLYHTPERAAILSMIYVMVVMAGLSIVFLLALVLIHYLFVGSLFLALVLVALSYVLRGEILAVIETTLILRGW